MSRMNMFVVFSVFYLVLQVLAIRNNINRSEDWSAEDFKKQFGSFISNPERAMIVFSIGFSFIYIWYYITAAILIGYQWYTAVVVFLVVNAVFQTGRDVYSLVRKTDRYFRKSKADKWILLLNALVLLATILLYLTK